MRSVESFLSSISVHLCHLLLPQGPCVPNKSVFSHRHHIGIHRSAHCAVNHNLRNFQTPRFVDYTSYWSKVLQLFFSSESEMQKLQKKTHNITSKMRNNASFQWYAPEDDKTGNMGTLLKPADSCAGLAKKYVLMALTNHSLTWDKNAFPLCCFSGVFDTQNE